MDVISQDSFFAWTHFNQDSAFRPTIPDHVPD